MDLFRFTHQIQVEGMSGYVRFVRASLPYAGGLYDQPARDMEALSVLEMTATAVVSEQSEIKRETRAQSQSKKKPRRR